MSWIRDKGLTFSLNSLDHPATEVDIFIQVPLDFSRAYAAAQQLDVAPGLPATFVGFEDLIFLKQQAGRREDLEDVERLQDLRGEMDHG